MMIHWQTWGPDHACLRESIGSVLALGVDSQNCRVFETISHPLPQETRGWVEEKGIRIDRSSYRRRDTLDDLKERLRVAIEAGEGDDYVLRLDSDVVACSMGSLEMAVQREYPAMAWAFAGSSFMGCCSLVKTEAYKAMADALEDQDYLDAIPYKIKGDTVIGHLLDRLYPGWVKVWHHRKGGLGKGWQYNYVNDEEHMAENFDFVTFGNRCQIKKNKKNKRETVAETMARFRRYYLNGAASQNPDR